MILLPRFQFAATTKMGISNPLVICSSCQYIKIEKIIETTYIFKQANYKTRLVLYRIRLIFYKTRLVL